MKQRYAPVLALLQRGATVDRAGAERRAATAIAEYGSKATPDKLSVGRLAELIGGVGFSES